MEGGLRKQSQYFLNHADADEKKNEIRCSTSEGHHLEVQRSALRGSSYLARVMWP